MSETSEHNLLEPTMDACRNCGHEFAEGDKYCANCSQKRKVSLTVGGIVHEFIHTTLHLDGKFFKMLHHLFVPGRLTNDFIAGKQKRYPHPVQFFIVVTAAFLLTFWKVAAPDFGSGLTEGFSNEVWVGQKIYTPVLGPTVSYAARTEAFFSDSSHFSSLLPKPVKDSLFATVFNIKRDSLWTDFFDTNKATSGVKVKFSSSVPIQDLFVMDPDTLLVKYDLDRRNTFKHLISRQAIKISQNPGAYGKKFIGNFALTLTLMVLIQALIMKLLYYKSKRNYVEHVLFLMNLTTVMLISLIPMQIIAVNISESANIFLWLFWILVFLLFHYFSMKQVYQQSYLRTFAKFCLYSFAYLFIGVLVFLFNAILTTFIFG